MAVNGNGEFIDASNVKPNPMQSSSYFSSIQFSFFSFYGRRTRIELIMARAFTSSNSIESVEAIKSNWFDWMAAGERMNVLNCKTIHMQRQFNSIKLRAVGGRESESSGTFILILIEIIYVRYRRRDGKRYN